MNVYNMFGKGIWPQSSLHHSMMAFATWDGFRTFVYQTAESRVDIAPPVP